MREREEIIDSLINDPKISRSLLWIFAKLHLHCELISKEVRHIAMLTLPWTSKQHQKWYPLIKELVVSWGLHIKPHPRTNGPFDYYIYSAGHIKEVNQIITLLRQIQLIPKMDRKRAYPLHRQIGRLLGYSEKVVNQQYK
ncbi:hypothetical protein KKE14_01040 [Patescibacteria group bacterium]|nr:hypothetical protein [Patescibacteria group bacterium]